MEPSLGITVVIPFHNEENTIVRAIRSVLEQAHSNVDVILVDDGSTDRSVHRVRQLGDSRIRICSQEMPDPPLPGIAGCRRP